MTGTPSLLERFLDLISRIGGGLLFLMALMIMADVSARWFTGKPLTGVFEATEIMLVAITFLVLGFVEHQHRQLNVDLLTLNLRGRRKAASILIDKALSLLFYGVLTWLAASEWRNAYLGGHVRRGLVEIPTIIPMGFIVLGAFLTTVAALAGLIRAAQVVIGGGEYRLPGGDEADGAH